MDDERLLEMVRAIRAWLHPELVRSDATRRMVAAVGEWLIEEARGASPAVPVAVPDDHRSVATAVVEPSLAPGTPAPEDSDAGALVPDAPAESPLPVTAPLWKLGGAFGRSDRAPRPPAESGPLHLSDRSDAATLALIERRCRLKARSCRVFIDRRAAIGDPIREASLVDQIDEILATARAMEGCFVWVLYRGRTQPSDENLSVLAGCYDALADAASLAARVYQLNPRPGPPGPCAELQLMAEASSALRVALLRTWLTSPETDQEESHVWLRRVADRDGLFLPRFMRLDDPADPDRHADLAAAIAAARQRLEDRARTAQRTASALQRLRYHSARIASGGDSVHPNDRTRLFEALGALLDLGVLPTDRRIGDALPPAVAAAVAAGAPDRILEALARVTEAPARRADAPEGPRPWTDQVHRVRRLIEGRQVVIVGGQPRHEAIDRIRDAFGLSSVCWVRLTEHGSAEPLHAPIAHRDTALVLVLVKLAGHVQADEAVASARAAGKPCVFVRAGYNPEQISEAVLQQASEQLVDS